MKVLRVALDGQWAWAQYVDYLSIKKINSLTECVRAWSIQSHRNSTDDIIT